MVDKKSYKKLVHESKLYYKSIGTINCVAIPNQCITFNTIGFKHLIYKGKKFRPIPDQVRRLIALRHVKDILTTTLIYSDHRTEYNGTTTANFWSFKKKVDNKNIIVILRKIDNKPLHFFSVMME